ncbi:MAG: ABC transporter permease, partial [Pseudomonadota bacterium]
MKRLDVLLRSCWHEFRAGAGNGIVSFTFIGLTAYLVLSLTSAEYMQTLGATDVPRNGASVIYLMVTGFMFFLFFAWAWIFAQPILRDRNASLHEAVLTTPVNLKILLLGRFLGACLLGILLGSSVLFGFFVAPLLETVGWMPAGSFSSPPWAQFGFSLVWLI